MRLYENKAMDTGKLFSLQSEKMLSDATEEEKVSGKAEKKGSLWDLFIPVSLLIATSIFAIVYVGGIFDADKDWLTAFSDTDASVALPWAAVLTAVFTVCYMTVRKIICFSDALKCLADGFIAMVPAILILTLATSLKNMTALLDSQKFIAECMTMAAPGLANFLPVVFFFVAAFLAFSTGTSWGTFGILIPIVISVFDPASPLLFIGMSACLAGAVCGDHCSPISDTTIMASVGAGCDHLVHVTTQFPYVITLAVISGFAFLL